MLLNNKDQYNKWVNSTGKFLRKWRSLTNEQRWFVYANARQVPGPKCATITKPISKMVWSNGRK